MTSLFLLLAGVCIVITWSLISVYFPAVTANLLLVDDAKFRDVSPINASYYIKSINNINLTICPLMCATLLPYCLAILYNSVQDICRPLKSHLNEDMVDRKSWKKGWQLYINNKGTV
jgi:hypothetical protein